MPDSDLATKLSQTPPFFLSPVLAPERRTFGGKSPKFQLLKILTLTTSLEFSGSKTTFETFRPSLPTSTPLLPSQTCPLYVPPFLLALFLGVGTDLCFFPLTSTGRFQSSRKQGLLVQGLRRSYRALLKSELNRSFLPSVLVLSCSPLQLPIKLRGALDGA